MHTAGTTTTTRRRRAVADRARCALRRAQCSGRAPWLCCAPSDSASGSAVPLVASRLLLLLFVPVYASQAQVEALQRRFHRSLL